MTLSRRTMLALPLTIAARQPNAATLEQVTLERVLGDLASVRERYDRFTEQKQLPDLELALPSQGTLMWMAPDRLEKHTTWPINERLSVAGDRLLYERPDRNVRRDFALAEQPEMQALVEAIRGTLAGDLAGLRRHHDVGFTQSGADWRVVLKPVSRRLREAIDQIVITGAGTTVKGVDTEGGGAVIRMRILPRP